MKEDSYRRHNMNIETRGIHYQLSDTLKEHIQEKLDKLKFAEKYVETVILSIDKRHDDYVIEMNITFAWGQTHHLKVEDKDLYDAIDIMDQKATTKIRREKEKKIDFYHS